MPVCVRGGAAVRTRESDFSELVAVLLAAKTGTFQLEDIIIVPGEMSMGSIKMQFEFPGYVCVCVFCVLVPIH